VSALCTALMPHPHPVGLFCGLIINGINPLIKSLRNIANSITRSHSPSMPIDLTQLQSLLTKAEANTANEKEIRKGLTRVQNLLTTIGQEVEKVHALLDGTAPAKKVRETDIEAPFGRKADGTPKKRPGRVKTEAAA